MTNPDCDKAVILAAGLGKRMRSTDRDARLTTMQADVASTGVKAMIPIDRPFLDYVLHNLADAGVCDICLVISPDHEQVRSYYQHQVHLDRVSISFAIQREPRGTADAVLAAEAFVGQDAFVMLNSDNHYPVEALVGLRRCSGPAAAVFTRRAMLRDSNITAERIAAYAVVEADTSGRLKRVIEKPDTETLRRLGDSVSLSMNCWRFDPMIFEACRRISPSVRGELEITDAVQLAIDVLGQRFETHICDQAVLDLSSRSDIAGVSEKLAGVEVSL